MTARELEMLKPSMGDLAVSGYGDRAYGTPEETIWNQAFEQARARIENPRWSGLGESPGGIDAPENVYREIFTPIQEAFHPEIAAYRSGMDTRNTNELARLDLARQEQERRQQALDLMMSREGRLAGGPMGYETVTEVIPGHEAVKEIPAMEEGRWNPFVPNRTIPAVPATPAVPEKRIVRRVPLGASVPTVPLPTNPAPAVIRYRLVNGQLVQ